MWLLFGTSAILFAILPLRPRRKYEDCYRFLSLSLTSLTLWAFYQDGARRVGMEDWAGLMDTMPSLSRALLLCTLSSIGLNAWSLYRSKNTGE